MLTASDQSPEWTSKTKWTISLQTVDFQMSHYMSMKRCELCSRRYAEQSIFENHI